MKLRSTVLIGALLVVPMLSQAADFATVGNFTGCQYRSIQDAVDHNVREVHVTTSGNTTQSPIVINGGVFRIYGGYPDCNTTSSPLDYDGSDASVLSVIDASASSGRAGVQINGAANVDIRNFRVTGAVNSAGTGGGISFKSNGSQGVLTLQSVLIDHNTANQGGGVYFQGASSSDVLAIYDHVFILNNTAVSAGGGVALYGDTYMLDIALQTQISGNKVQDSDNGAGGGVYLQDHASMDLGSPGYDGAAVIDGNTAIYGAGLYATGATNLRLYSTQPGQYVRLEHNIGSYGSGIYLAASSAHPRLCGYGVGINANSAKYTVLHVQ